MSELNLWPESFKEENGKTTISATIERPTGRLKLWFQVPSEYQDLLTTNCDPFVVGVIFIAMAEKSDLVVHGEVSPSLMRNLEEFQSAWSCWRPEQYGEIDIRAEVEKEIAVQPEENSAVVAFSGGVDSTFSVFRHAKGLAWKRPRCFLKSGVLIHGFDIPLEQEEVFQRVRRSAEAVLASVGLNGIPVSTNFRCLPTDWEDSHGSGLAAALMIFQKAYRAGIIGSTEPYNALELPWGSNPITDTMLSGNNFEIIHDGAAYGRIEKVRMLVHWPEGVEKLRVCWQGNQLDRNCGRCEKCIRTILNFRVIGAGLPACFDRDVTDQDILGLTKLNKVQQGELSRIVAYAQNNRISGSWVKALEKTLKRSPNGSICEILKRKAKKVRSRLKGLFTSE